MPACRPNPGRHRNNAAEWLFVGIVWPLRWVLLGFESAVGAFCRIHRH